MIVPMLQESHELCIMDSRIHINCHVVESIVSFEQPLGWSIQVTIAICVYMKHTSDHNNMCLPPFQPCSGRSTPAVWFQLETFHQQSLLPWGWCHRAEMKEETDHWASGEGADPPALSDQAGMRSAYSLPKEEDCRIIVKYHTSTVLQNVHSYKIIVVNCSQLNL